mmetsp:Transcript_7660/g.32538  ORF Transcript_7660/g.32538 Transcript_7660/m.32538 type:complete len:252 (+) Transcript_7660:275-1030(+)
MGNEIAPRYVRGLAPSTLLNELYVASPRSDAGTSAYAVCACTRMTNAVKSGTKKTQRVNASFRESHPNARAKMTKSMPASGIAGDAANVPGSPPSITPGPLFFSVSQSGSSLGSHSRVVTMRHATHPMSTSISAANGEKRVWFQNIQFGCVFAAIVPSMKNHALQSYEYASFIRSEMAVKTPIATRSPRARHRAMGGSAKGSAAVANVSAERNHVGAFHSSACAGNHACVKVHVMSACHAVAIGPLYRLSA